MNILFIGAGKMATALAGGIARGKLFPNDRLDAVDPLPAAREAFTAATGVEAHPEATQALVAQADVIVLAVKPQVAQATVAGLPQRKDGVLVVSICAGIPLAKLRSWLGDVRLVRVMPNTPLLVGKGASCYALSREDDADADAFAAKVLGSLGKAWRVPEEKLDAVTALSGSGQAYFFAFIEALREGGEKLGLEAELAEQLAVQTMAGATEMLLQKKGTPSELRIAVTSKGGTTAAALDAMARRDFNGMVAELLTAARDRSVELGKN
ncbi:MAG: pyrroline-5-carboxylate reductase [Victivallales bacterium]|nr:pyrroline-5-carboxylate reductase [Victivallales bacterium]